MNFSSLNDDALFHLVKFLDPIDQFNLLLSGILKGFESVNEGIDLRHRINDFGIKLLPCRDRTCQLEIRSLTNNPIICHEQLPEDLLTILMRLTDGGFLKNNPISYPEQFSESHFIILKRLADGGYLKNNRQWIVEVGWTRGPWLFEVIRSMTNLETLSLLECQLTLTDLPQLLRSSTKLTYLHLKLIDGQKLEMNEELKNELRSAFQRLRRFGLRWEIESWPAIQEMFTWLKECAQLIVMNYNSTKLVMDGSLELSPELARNLRVLDLYQFPVEFIKWVLSFCPNIHTLKLHLIDQPKDLHYDIVRLEKLKDLQISATFGVHPKEVIRNCRQVEILRVNVSKATLQDLAELEHYENLKEVHLRWSRGPSGKEALPILKRCTNLRRLILGKWELDTTFSSKELCDFITKLKHLTYLHIIYHDNPDCNHFKSVVDEVKTFVLSRRPNFKFYISCCEMFDESRVESCT